VDDGALSGGEVTVEPDPACIDDTITFTVTGVVDSGGVKRENCQLVNIPAGTIEYTWLITKPDSTTVSGSGSSAGVVADQGGVYSCTFTTSANRDCAPADDMVDGTASTVDIVSVEWEQYAPDSTPLDGCPNNGGKRIFPGKLSPTDPSAGDRRKANLLAKISPVVEGCTVYFKVWDVDDPFDQNNPTMPNVNLIDNDTNGPDNRGSDPGVGQWSAVMDADGEARVTVTVSMQPRNNYRAGASVDVDALNAATQGQVDTNSPPEHVKFTDMLTVWRKLWIERDTMGAPGLTEITFSGTAGTVTMNDPVAGLSTVDLGQNLPDEFSDLNLYEEGTIRFFSCPSGSDTFSIVESTSEMYPLHDSVVILGLPGTCATGSAYLLREDDDVNVLPHYPNGGQLLINAYGDAYILPQYAGAEYQDVVDFDMHLSDWDIEYGLGTWSDDRDLSSSAEFWSCLVVGCWEAGQDWDGDPDHCFSLTVPYVARPGAEGIEKGCTDGDSGQGAIYMQGLADDAGCLYRTDEAHIVTHEIGHTCGSHDDHVPGSIMEVGAPRGENRFATESIVIFRSEVTW